MLGWLLALLLGVLARPPDARALPKPGDCPLGCFSDTIPGSESPFYRVRPQDIVWLAKVLRQEAGPRLVKDEAAATAWALVQGWRRWNVGLPADRRLGIAAYVQNYSAACSKRWAPGGDRYSPRITPRAARCRAEKWVDIPGIWRDFAADFMRGLYPCHTPGLVHVLARGFEQFADDSLIGPIYVVPLAVYRGSSAFYATPDTAHWTTTTVALTVAESGFLEIVRSAAAATIAP